MTLPELRSQFKLQTFHIVRYWNNFKTRLLFSEDMDTSYVASFLWTAVWNVCAHAQTLGPTYLTISRWISSPDKLLVIIIIIAKVGPMWNRKLHDWIKNQQLRMRKTSATIWHCTTCGLMLTVICHRHDISRSNRFHGHQLSCHNHVKLTG